MGEVVVNMALLNTRAFCEKEEGEVAAELYQLDRLVRVFDKIIVIFPADTFAVTNSFFKGMFGRYLAAAGSKEEFLKRFAFKAPYMIDVDINDMIDHFMLFNTSPDTEAKTMPQRLAAFRRRAHSLLKRILKKCRIPQSKH